VSEPPLLRERRDGVARLTLNRPAKRNALSIELRELLAGAVGEAVTDEDVGCLLLTGAGSAFCSGMDTTQFGGDRAHRERLVSSSRAAFEAVALCPKPMVAAVNGPAIAGGFALALHCDIRVASTTATLGFPEIGRHIPPAFAAASAALPPALARELCLTGRVLDAGEAQRLGVVGEVHPPDVLLARAHELAAGIAAAPRRAVLTTKARILRDGEQTWRRALENEGRELEQALLGP
jgi:enoyl-CoA hydratase